MPLQSNSLAASPALYTKILLLRYGEQEDKDEIRMFWKLQTRKRGPDVWQFRWSETNPNGERVHHKKVIATIEHYPDESFARRAVVGLVSEINTDAQSTNSRAMTIAQHCDHFEQRELAKENIWRSHATKKIYHAYLTRWIRPHWERCELGEVRTIQVESWLRGLPLAKS